VFIGNALGKPALWDKGVSPAPWTARPGAAQKTGRTLGLHLILFERAESMSECAVQLGTRRAVQLRNNLRGKGERGCEDLQFGHTPESVGGNHPSASC
jgi:hypothetical protein